MLLATGGTTRITEKNVHMTIFEDGTVFGKGKNKFGSFALFGTINDGSMKVYKV